jgi:hypothetical protein
VRRTGIAGLALLAAVVTGTPLTAQEFSCPLRGGAQARAARAARPSPPDSIAVALGGQTVKLCYGRPSARGRRVMGALVPYGQPWRLGANEATTIHLPFAAEIGGVRVGPGTYTLYAIPGETEWRLVVNRAVDRWGIPIDDAVRRQDVGAATVRVERLAQPVETLTLRFEPPRGRGTALVIEWERTRVRVPIVQAE